MNKIDKCTFGNTPAAMYLADRLNEIGDPRQVRKVSAFINSARNILSQAVTAHQECFMSIKTLYFVVDSLSERIKGSIEAQSEAGYRSDNPIDSLCVNLMTNILVGEIKSIKRRVQRAANLQHQQEQLKGKYPGTSKDIFVKLKDDSGVQRSHFVGTIVKEKVELRAITIEHIGDDITPEVLVKRSKKRLKRLNKTDTLY